MSEEKGFRRAKCGNDTCGKVLRFVVTVEMYGTTRKVRCPSCLAVGQVTIPHPATPHQTRPARSFAETFFESFFPNGSGDIRGPRRPRY